MSINIEIPLEELELADEQKIEECVKDESGGSITFAFIGSGQAGGRIVESFYNLGYKKAICVNTAEHDLNSVNVPDEQKFLMDIGSKGAGKNMELGENAASKHSSDIYDLMKKTFGTDVQRIIVTAGLGGGTGGGSVLVLLDLARKYLDYIGVENPRTKVGAIVTLPTTGEAMSPIVAKNAQIQAERLSEYAAKKEISPLLFIDNDKISKMYSSLTVKAFWPAVNNTISALFHSFNVITTESTEFQTFDPEDYSSVLSVGGCMILGVTNVKDFSSETSISQALRANLERTLLADGFNLKSAKAAACVVLGGEKLFETVQGLQNSINFAFDTLANVTGNVTLHRGVYSTEKEKLSVLTMIAGLDAPSKRIERLTKSINQEKNLYGE